MADEEDLRKCDHPTGYDVWRWPEFIAFAERLGIPSDRPTKDINIFIPLEGIVTITEEYLGDQLFNARRRRGVSLRSDGAAETTTVQNEQFKTFIPIPDLPREPDRMDIDMVSGLEDNADE